MKYAAYCKTRGNNVDKNLYTTGSRIEGADKALIGRCDRIRTYDPFTPSEVRYQAALHTDRGAA